MPATEELDAVSQVYENHFKEAWRAFEAGEFEKTNATALRFFQEPDLGDLHASGFHFILAHFFDQYL